MKSILESIVRVAIVAIIFMGVMYLLKTGINHINGFDLDEKAEAFKEQKTLLCSVGIANNQKILVNKNNSWEIYKEVYFKKGDMLLEIRLCKEEQK